MNSSFGVSKRPNVHNFYILIPIFKCPTMANLNLNVILVFRTITNTFIQKKNNAHIEILGSLDFQYLVTRLIMLLRHIWLTYVLKTSSFLQMRHRNYLNISEKVKKGIKQIKYQPLVFSYAVFHCMVLDKHYLTLATLRE